MWGCFVIEVANNTALELSIRAFLNNGYSIQDIIPKKSDGPFTVVFINPDGQPVVTF